MKIWLLALNNLKIVQNLEKLQIPKSFEIS
jgi:hypothetical protein